MGTQALKPFLHIFWTLFLIKKKRTKNQRACILRRRNKRKPIRTMKISMMIGAVMADYPGYTIPTEPDVIIWKEPEQDRIFQENEVTKNTSNINCPTMNTFHSVISQSSI